mgnify:CR=1 FL=1
MVSDFVRRHDFVMLSGQVKLSKKHVQFHLCKAVKSDIMLHFSKHAAQLTKCRKFCVEFFAQNLGHPKLFTHARQVAKIIILTILAA